MPAPTMTWRSARLLLLAGAIVLAACARNTVEEGETGPLPAAIVIFDNQGLSQADVFAVIPGVTSRKIGTVFAGRTDTLSVPGDITIRSNLTIVARLLAGRSVGSGPVTLRPGDAVRVTLPVDQRLLSVLPANED